VIQLLSISNDSHFGVNA
jgi:DnaJ-related protein SCJ1